MTNENVSVEQCDRDAAADLYEAEHPHPGDAPYAVAIRLDRCDDHPYVRAFAGHRVAAASTPAGEDFAALARIIDPDACWENGDMGWATPNMVLRRAKARRKAKAALSSPPAQVEEHVRLAEALNIAADELNVELDRQTYDERLKLGDYPDDTEFCVTLTAKQMRAFDMAICAYQHGTPALSSPPIVGVEQDVLNSLAEMMAKHVTNWPAPKKLKTAIALINKTLKEAISSPPPQVEDGNQIYSGLRAWIEQSWPQGSGSDFNQGVVRGFEIIKAQLEQGHIQHWIAAEPARDPQPSPGDRAIMASVKLGAWLSAALDAPSVCDAMKADITEWFSAGEPVTGWAAYIAPPPSTAAIDRVEACPVVRGDKVRWARGLDRRPLAVIGLDHVTVASWGLPEAPLAVTLQEVAGSFSMGFFDRIESSSVIDRVEVWLLDPNKYEGPMPHYDLIETIRLARIGEKVPGRDEIALTIAKEDGDQIGNTYALTAYQAGAGGAVEYWNALADAILALFEWSGG